MTNDEILKSFPRSGLLESKITPEMITGKTKVPVSNYKPTPEEQMVRSMIIKHFTLGDLNQRKPRREFNDLALLVRAQIDRMSFNIYQPNDGDPLDGNITQAWKSNAIRPTTRNKVISIAAHATARILFPKIFAQDEQSEDQEDCAQVMEDLMEWTGQQSDYSKTGLYATINALVEPASIVYTDYSETYRRVKSEKGADGLWHWEEVLDNVLSGFQDAIVPVDELYIENFYEHDIQKQGWLIWRRVHNYSLMEAKYGHLPNFKHVKPGIQIVYDDANRLFYEVYDSSMRGEMCEEIIYWNRTNDLKIIMVNGVMLTDYDNPNPRQDKLYPFTKFGYELIDGGRCFYYKSLAFKMGQDAKVINTLYQMVMDGTYLQLFPPMINKGGEAIGSDVLIPGAVTTFSDPNADLRPLTTQNNIGAGIQAMGQVEQSISETSMDQWMQGTGVSGKRMAAYSMSIIQQNANTLLGLFIQMISIFVKDFGKLRLGDILQYMTIADVQKIEDDGPLVFKAFLLHNKQSKGRQVTKKIQFDNTLPEDVSDEGMDWLSIETLEKGGGMNSKNELWRVNPEKFRELQFTVAINPDVLNPMSEETEKEMGLEAYDRLIQNPSADPEMVTKEFLLKNYKASQRDPDKFIKTQNPAASNDPLALAQQVAQNGGKPLPGGKPGVAPQQPNPAQVAQGLPKV